MKKVRSWVIGIILVICILLLVRWIPHLLYPDLVLPVAVSTPITSDHEPFISENTDATTTHSITILIGGDIMLDRYIRKQGETDGYDSLFSGITSLFHTVDIGVANLEGPITSQPSKTLVDGKTTQSLSFTFATSSVSALKGAGITLVDLANNHTDNFGTAGLTETHSELEHAGISWFGDPGNLPETDNSICKNTICVTFVGYNEFHHGYPRMVETVKKLTTLGRFVIVMAHWGDEYATSAPLRVHGEAQGFIDAGAKAVIGSHPHVIEDTSWINGVPVVYSLGNLIFDQYFSPAVMKGELVELTIEKSGNQTILKRMQTFTVSNADKKAPMLISNN